MPGHKVTYAHWWCSAHHRIILVGLLISYLPQHYRIITRGTAEGISPYFVLLGTTSATSGFANILTLPQSRQDVACCKVLDRFECVAGLLGIAQLGAQWVCFTFMSVAPCCPQDSRNGQANHGAQQPPPLSRLLPL